MIYHALVPGDGNARSDRPYAPPSLAEDGFIHCSPDESTTLAVINAFYRNAPRPLRVLVLDEDRLEAELRWEAATPAPPPGVAEGTLFPHVFGPINRDAVERVEEVQWDEGNRAVCLRRTD
ncbi:DUF952 domain-containing protein [Streptomyces sp. NBC_01497]|uniref:DUF952 domain-containing protein n=1 Tax=Streptomyces sp. NBC_01497 TaxID=2903885 RepID=UPI002E36029D|nr:DUF952 domain-containing protein [Streptomyces sp. NBC_01497]